MKDRPRSVEREVAKRLSLFYSQFCLGEVKRIPVIGRTGPDIQINEFGLVVDVKSRKRIAKWAFDASAIRVDGLIGGVLDEMDFSPPKTTKSNKDISNWYAHMKQWCDINFPIGIPALVLHLPGKPVSKSTVFIAENYKEMFNDRKSNPISRTQLLNFTGIVGCLSELRSAS